MQRPVELAIAAAIEPVAALLATRCVDRAGAGERGEGCLARHPARVTARDEQLGAADRSHPALLEQLGRDLGEEGSKRALGVCHLLRESLERAGIAYFRSYDLRHSCATLLLYEGRTLNEVAEHLGHADPGFTARTYAHVMRDASRRRRVPITEAIVKARAAASRRPLVDPLGRESASRASRSAKKALQIERADARTRTADPFITS